MDVSDWRNRINNVDRKILDLLNERGRYVLKLAPLKRREKIPIREPNREREVLQSLRRENQGPLSDEAVCRIFEAIMEEMRAIQETAAGSESAASEKRPKGSSKSSSQESESGRLRSSVRS